MTTLGTMWRLGLFRTLLVGGAISFLSPQSASAQSVTIDTKASSAVYPAWLKPAPLPNQDGTLNQLAFAVSVPGGAAASSSDLLLTVVFDDAAGGFLRVYRQDGDAAEMISDNLFEGTGLPNRRTLLLHHLASSGATTIVFQADGAAQPVRRLVWEWPQAQPVPVVGDAPAVVRNQAGIAAADVSGQPLPSPQPNVDTGYTSTPLLDKPARIEGNALFGATLGRLPAHAVLSAKVAGLPLGAQLECWINGQRAGALAAALPSLRDPAYLLAPGQPAVLAAWREASAYLPATAWRAGDNEIELRPADPADPADAKIAYALKDVVLEFVYDETPPPAPASTP